MLYVLIGKTKFGTEAQRIAKRMEWKFPDVGAEEIGEYWLETLEPCLINIFRADTTEQIWAIRTGWDEFLDISIYPAIEAQEGLELLRKWLAAQS